MAGSEKRGLEALNHHLFENAPWIFCHEESSQIQAKQLQTFLNPIGIKSLWLNPQLHDFLVARISHLPQVLASSLAGYFLSQPLNQKQALAVAGRGFKDMTRLSKSSLNVWEPIFNSNHTAILQELKNLQSYFSKVISQFEKKQFAEFFNQGANWPQSSKDDKKHEGSIEPVEIRVTCEDTPGMLTQILAPLSEQHINIEDIEVLKNRENETGTIRIILSDPTNAQQALNTLKSHGKEAVIIQ
jgi:prephenate dehydrogenase